ncbi:MAG: hypothetical protein NPIRA05_19120 [Nitrospirales bacterium]|nr:MAG: hypothetical protein NPIRA05_19120 [Nitrospirales bacterium]
MPKLVEQPCVIPPVGQNPKLIEEYAGRVATGSDTMSLARIVCPAGWSEVGQQPEFTETKVVLKGMLRVESKHGVLDVRSGQAVICEAGEWVRYSTPETEGAVYITVCVPAFSPATVHRDAE